MNTLDVVNSMSARKAVEVAYFTATQIDPFNKGEQIAGVALFLNELCATLKLDARDILNKAQRMAKDADTHYAVEVKALREYISKEF